MCAWRLQWTCVVEVLADGEVREQRGVLRGEGCSAFVRWNKDVRARVGEDGAVASAVADDVRRIGMQQPGDRAKDAGLAGARRAEEYGPWLCERELEVQAKHAEVVAQLHGQIRRCI